MTGSCLDARKAYTCEDTIEYNKTLEYGKVSECHMEVCGSDLCSPLKIIDSEIECTTPIDGKLSIYLNI